MRQTYEYEELNFFSFYRIDRLIADNLHKFLAQLLETYIEQGDSVILLSLTKDEFYKLARAYRDLSIGYHKPRRDSGNRVFHAADPTLRKLQEIFPKLKSLDVSHSQA